MRAKAVALCALLALACLGRAAAEAAVQEVAIDAEGEAEDSGASELAAAGTIFPGEVEGEFWRVLGPDEGVPPGSHVRLNITSLQKTIRVDAEGEAVLLGQEGYSTGLVAQPEAASDETASDEAAVPAVGAGAAAAEDPAARSMEVLQQAAAEDAADGVGATAESREMIRDTLLGLPDSELSRYGISSAELQTEGAWEDRVAEVWRKRQVDLKAAMESVADTHSIFTGYLGVLQDPAASAEELVAMLDVVAEQLMDVDLANDFHSMGGWPIVAALLAEEHPEGVRAAAAAVIADSVRNVPEFQGWVGVDKLGRLEVVGDDAGGDGSGEVTALDLLTDMFSSSSSTPKEQQKALFALSAALYNHPANLDKFLDLGGAAKLSAVLAPPEGAPKQDSKLIQRAINIAADLAFEAAESASDELRAVLARFFEEGLCAVAGEGAGAWKSAPARRAYAMLLMHAGEILPLKEICSAEELTGAVTSLAMLLEMESAREGDIAFFEDAVQTMEQLLV